MLDTHKCHVPLFLVFLSFIGRVFSITSYANIFFDPSPIVGKQYNDSTHYARQSIISWADDLAAEGPWAVTNKSFTPTGADSHDYVSFAPYWWPDCSSVGNTTELTPEQVWAQCPYSQRDGKFNPDYLSVNNSGGFNALADAVLYNSLAWSITGASNYSSIVARFIKTWFFDPETGMNPNLNYAQMQRGPQGQKGAHTGLLDLRGICKILSGILILRKQQSKEWTSELDTQFRNWSTTYIQWLNTAELAIEEKNATNNHGTFYFNQLAAFQILVDDTEGAKKTLEEYFNGIFQHQIEANGEQPEEASRTRPYHYRAYNALSAAINARLAKYVGYDTAWTTKSSQGATIQDAVDYIIETQKPPTDEDSSRLDMYPVVAMVASTLGDNGAKYTTFLKNADSQYPLQPWFLWEQPLSDSGLVIAEKKGSGSGSGGSNNKSGEKNDAVTVGMSSVLAIIMVGIVFSLL